MRLLLYVCRSLAPLLPALLLAAAAAQDAGTGQESGGAEKGQGQEESELERYLRLAREGSAVVRPQAAQRLVALGEPAAERLFAECGEGPEEMAGLGAELVEVLGEFSDPRLRAKLWEAIGDADFPWRPPAARALAKSPAAASLEEPEGEAERFLHLFADPLATVREAALQGVARLDLRSEKERVRPLLADPDDRVRRMAATVLFQWGEPCTVAWIRAELERDDRYFELETGKLARYKALELLEGQLDGRLKRDFGFDPERTWGDAANAEAAQTIDEHCRRLCPAGLPELPPVARTGRATEGDVLGLEIRSCRKGEYFLRWNAADVLYVGLGNAVAIELPAGTVARLLEAARPRLGALGKERLWGQPGCDLEQIHWRADPGSRTTSFRVSKGQKRVEGLRPAPIGELERLLLATLPEDGEDARTADLRRRVGAALEAVGGPLAD